MGVNGEVNGKQNGVPAYRHAPATRLDEGRALNEDVWSIFKYVTVPEVVQLFFLTSLR